VSDSERRWRIGNQCQLSEFGNSPFFLMFQKKLQAADLVFFQPPYLNLT